MRRCSIVLALVPVLLGGPSAWAQCAGEGGDCDRPVDLHLSSAFVGHPPLIWSSIHARLVPPPEGGEPVVLGDTIPLGRIVGLKIAPVGGLPKAVSYNDPASFPGAADQGTVLMPLLRPKHPARYRGEYP